VLLTVLAEAVNAVADLPYLECMCADEPVNKLVGYVVGDMHWTIPIRDLRMDRDEVDQKQRQLAAMLKKARPIPLRPFPADAYSRELHLRYAVLTSAVQIGSIEMRQQTAKFITMLGKLRSLTT
jgi:hypothetical protein